ncbi:MAG: hypothetical protein AAB781_02125 [Patescibacteria group bacterium]
MKQVLNIYKKAGETPLEAINRFRAANPEYRNVKITYAGRLDPLAEGVLILLAGDAVYEKEKYLKLDKEYEAEILFGFETDTYDILGLPKRNKKIENLKKEKLAESLKVFIGASKMPFPPYSSYKIKGKPLFQWTREGKINEIKIPERKTTVYEIKLLSLKNISGQKLLKKIEQKINLVKGDFRQKEILKEWQEKMLPNLSDSKNKEAFWTAKIKIKCSSGTYIRSIANYLGKKMKTGGAILSLTRTKVGEFEIKDSLQI